MLGSTLRDELKLNYMHFEHPLFEMCRTKNASALKFFQILEYLHRHRLWDGI